MGGWPDRQAGQPERLVSEPPPINLLFSTEGSSRQPIAVNNAWNGLASGQTNRVVNEEQLKSAAVASNEDNGSVHCPVIEATLI